MTVKPDKEREVAVGLGFEPRRAAPKTAVLPLDDPTIAPIILGRKLKFQSPSQRLTKKFPISKEIQWTSKTAWSCFLLNHDSISLNSPPDYPCFG